jgi:hypothetical protein
MDKPEFVITQGVGRKLMEWCSQGITLESARKEISDCETIEGLKHLYQKHTSMKTMLHKDFMSRKSQIESNSQMVKDTEVIKKPDDENTS